MRRAALLLGLGAAVAALALTASPSEQAQPPAKVTHDELPVFVHTGNTLEIAWSRFSAEGQPERLADTLAVFGSVCIFREPFASNCVPALLHGAYPQVDAGWRSLRGQVWGLANNAAVSVRVHLDSGWLAAKLGRNGFYLELPPRIVAPRQIVIRERSGIRHVYDIKRCRVDDIALSLLAGPVAPPLC